VTVHVSDKTTTQYNLTTSVDPVGAATITPSGTYPSGTQVTVTVTYNYNGPYVFAGWWTVDGATVQSLSTQMPLVMNRDHTVVAHFIPNHSPPVKATMTLQGGVQMQNSKNHCPTHIVNVPHP